MATYEQVMVEQAALDKQILQEWRRLRDPQNWHPYANVNPLVPVPGLAESIGEHGLRHPITLARDGKLLEGRTRVLALARPDQAEELLGSIQTLDPGEDPLEFVLSENAERRHLNPSQRAMAAAKALKLLDAEESQAARERQRAGLKRGKKAPVRATLPARGRLRDKVSEASGAKSRTVADALKVLREADPETVQAIDAGKLKLGRAVKVLKRRKAQAAALEAARTGKLPTDTDIILGDGLRIMAAMPENSVELIFTDPPYLKDDVPRYYGPLAREAARVLKPGGSLIAYIGGYALPDALDLMRPHLTYRWLLVQLHGGPHSRMHGLGLQVHYKPLLWFTKGGFKPLCTDMTDKVHSDPPDKSLHDWAQSVTEAEYYIGKLTLPGAVILDPFVGSGTTLLAAQRVGDRRAIGIEIVPKEARKAKGRLVMAGEGEAKR